VGWRSSVPFLVLLSGCAFAPTNAGPPEPGLSANELRTTRVLRTVCGAFPASEECIAERRHIQRMNMEQKTQRTVEVAADREVAAAHEAAGLAHPGDGQHLGQGWWCFSGTYRGKQAFGRCFRSIETCADRFVARVDDGMKADEAQCAQQATASCFTSVDATSGDLDDYCFPATATCERYETRTRETDLAEVTPCTRFQ